MRTLFVLFTFSILGFSCEENESDPQTRDDLDQLYAEIKALSESETCTDSSDWRWTAYGAKACGGPQGYIAYSLKIDTNIFLSKVKAYSEAEAEYNQANEIGSDCSIPTEPSGVVCEDGLAVFSY